MGGIKILPGACPTWLGAPPGSMMPKHFKFCKNINFFYLLEIFKITECIIKSFRFFLDNLPVLVTHKIQK